jgi:hypothetical protein
MRPLSVVRQRGVVLLLFMFVFFLGAMSWLLAQGNTGSLRRRIDATTAAAMAEAKAALIGRAAQDGNRPGSLTCPDTDDDGVANQVGGNCASYIGRVPWKTLDMEDPRDGWGERLWYALTDELRDNPAAHPINSQKTLQLSLDGVANHAALIFSPGPPLPGQHGRRSDAVADYLDESNNDGDFAYVSGPRSASFNDTVLAITRDELFRTVNMRILAEIRGPVDSATGAFSFGLRGFHAGNGMFPWADTGADGYADADAISGRLPCNDLNFKPETLTWLNANNWLELVSYQSNEDGSALISIGSSQMTVVSCLDLPCP